MDEQPTPPELLTDGLPAPRADYRNAILAGDRREALRIVSDAAAINPYLDVLAEVVAGAQREVGELWERGRITIAEEHLATAVSQFVIASAFPWADSMTPRLGFAVVCGVEGDLHHLGLHIAADALEADGWEVRLLGGQLPREDAVADISARVPDLIAIGASMATHLDEVAELTRALRDQLGDDCPPVLFGGRAFDEVPVPVSDPAPAAATDIREAVRLARGFSGRGEADLQPVVPEP